jgi:hypothetical protein
MRLQFLGATDTVTGSKYLLQHRNSSLPGVRAALSPSGHMAGSSFVRLHDDSPRGCAHARQ